MHGIDIIAAVFMAGGAFFMITGAAGLLRFPDFYTRLHAGTKCTTFGSILLIIAVLIQSVSVWVVEGGSSPQSILSIHAFIALIAILVTNPTGAHAIARAGHKSGVKPVRAVVDDLEKEENA